jgi:DNA adenine methylase
MQEKNIKKKPIPFRYAGGKFYALKYIAPYWTHIQHDEYREPFVGGGSVFFTKNKSKYNIINDIDTELITTYRVMQDCSARIELLNRLSKEIASKERWQEIRNFIPQNDLDVAYKYYYLNRTSFSGKLSSPAWGYREKRSLPPERWGERIVPCGQLLEGVTILNEDFDAVIKMPAKGKNVLMFIDPPYYKPSKKKHYRNGFTIDDHLRLADCLKKTKYKFILTYEDTAEIRDLYSWATINEMRFSYRVDNSAVNDGKREKGCELIITNYSIDEPTLF